MYRWEERRKRYRRGEGGAGKEKEVPERRRRCRKGEGGAGEEKEVLERRRRCWRGEGGAGEEKEVPGRRDEMMKTIEQNLCNPHFNNPTFALIRPSYGTYKTPY